MTLDPERAARLWAEQSEDLRRLKAIERRYPLASQVLWTAPHAAWDQRRAVIGAATSPVFVVTGGWRSGKSWLLKQLNAATAMGGSHPAVRAWLHLNDLPEDLVPEEPRITYMIAQSSNDSMVYHRDDFDRLVGSYGSWVNRNGKGQACLTISRPGSKAQGKIWFKSLDQGVDAFQGSSVGRADIDEEPWGPDGYEIFDELRARVADQGGHVGIGMVPKHGYTWVYERLIIKRQFRARHAELNALDNPFLPANFADLYEGLTDDERAVRQHGQFRALTGMVYSMWKPGDGTREGNGHVVEDFPIPDGVTRFRGGDFGLVDPTAIVWGFLADDNTLYVYRVYFEPNGRSYRWHAENVARIEGLTEDERGRWVRGPEAERIEAGWGDPAAKEARQEFSSCGVQFATANNDVKGGIDRVKERLRVRGDGRPRLKVFASCVDLIREFPAYEWDPHRRDEMPIKKNDHALDALRYLVQGVAAWNRLLGGLH